MLQGKCLSCLSPVTVSLGHRLWAMNAWAYSAEMVILQVSFEKSLWSVLMYSIFISYQRSYHVRSLYSSSIDVLLNLDQEALISMLTCPGAGYSEFGALLVEAYLSPTLSWYQKHGAAWFSLQGQRRHGRPAIKMRGWSTNEWGAAQLSKSCAKRFLDLQVNRPSDYLCGIFHRCLYNVDSWSHALHGAYCILFRVVRWAWLWYHCKQLSLNLQPRKTDGD